MARLKVTGIAGEFVIDADFGDGATLACVTVGDRLKATATGRETDSESLSAFRSALLPVLGEDGWSKVLTACGGDAYEVARVYARIDFECRVRRQGIIDDKAVAYSCALGC